MTEGLSPGVPSLNEEARIEYGFPLPALLLQ